MPQKLRRCKSGIETLADVAVSMPQKLRRSKTDLEPEDEEHGMACAADQAEGELPHLLRRCKTDTAAEETMSATPWPARRCKTSIEDASAEVAVPELRKVRFSTADVGHPEEECVLESS